MPTESAKLHSMARDEHIDLSHITPDVHPPRAKSPLTGGRKEIFATLDDFFASQRTRAQEVFREFDRDHRGGLELHDVTSLMLRLIPDVDRKDMRYIRNMVDITGVKQFSFQDVTDLLEECRKASQTMLAKPSALDDLKYKLRTRLPRSRAEALAALQQLSFPDHKRSTSIDHAKVAKIVRQLHPTTDVIELRLVLAALYIIDWGGKGAINVEELLDVLLSDEPVPRSWKAPIGGSGGVLAWGNGGDAVADTAAPSARQDLRRAVELHKEHEARLVQAMRGAQECMAVDADELRRDARRIELFEAHLLTVAEKIQASGHALQEDLKAGFDAMQAVLVERAQALLSQAADVTAERLAMVRAQSERADATGAEVMRVIRMAEESLEEKDPLTVMSMNEKFEQEISSLHDSGRLRSLEACTNEEIGLVVDFKSAKEELQDILEFQRPSEGVAGPLRGAAAMKVLREVYGTLDHEGSGVISKAALMAALREDRKVMELLKMPLLTAETGGAALGPSETFEETFRKIDIDGTDSLSWPEFASYFGKAYLGFAGLPTEYKAKTQTKQHLLGEVQKMQAELEHKSRLLDESTREAERLAALLERAETFAAQQASRHEEVMGAVHIEKAALQREFEAKLKAIEAENAARQADFEARLHQALQRSEEVLSREEAIRKHAESPPPLPHPPPPPPAAKPHHAEPVSVPHLQPADLPPPPGLAPDAEALVDDLDTRSERSETDGQPGKSGSRSASRPGSARNSHPSSASARRPAPVEPKVALYNNRAIGHNEDKSGVPLRLQAEGVRNSNRLK